MNSTTVSSSSIWDLPRRLLPTEQPTWTVMDLWDEQLARERDTPTTSVCLRCGETTHVAEDCRRYKTRLCRFWRAGTCHAGSQRCQFAHGERELRHPWERKCVRVEVTGEDTYVIRGCLLSGHTFHTCPTRHTRLHDRPRQETTTPCSPASSPAPSATSCTAPAAASTTRPPTDPSVP